MRACSTATEASILMKSSPHRRMLPRWPTPCWKLWPITITSTEARDCQEYQRQQDNTESPMADFPSPMPVDQDEPTDLEGLEGTTAAPSPSSSATTVPPLSVSATLVPTKKKISLQEYNCCKATEQQQASTYLDRDENGEDYEDFEPQDDPANFQIGYRILTPVLQASDLPTLQDASTPVPQQAATLAASDVTTPMHQHSTSPGTVPGMTAHNVATVANPAPGFGRGLPVARALPMQVGTPPASASPMQVTTLAASLHRTPGHVFAAEEALLWGATLPCSPWQEAHLLNLPVILTDNHIKMMDAVCHLDSYGLQFICKSAEALRRERMPTQAPPGYRTPQASDALWGLISHPPLSQEFYRATSNLSTAIMEPRQIPPQQCLVQSCRLDPEIKSAIANMHRHEQAWSMPSTDSNNNPRWGHGPSRPLITQYTCKQSLFIQSLRNSEDRRLETQGTRPLLICRVIFTVCSCNFCIFIIWIFVSLYRMCSFQENHVNIFALCSRLYHYVFMICFRFSHICVLYIYHSRPPFVVMNTLSVLYSVMHCIIIPSTVCRIISLCSVP